MALWKRGKQYWLNVVINGQRYRHALGTTDPREARNLEKQKIAEYALRRPDPAKRRQVFGSLPLTQAVERYIDDRRAQVSKRMRKYWTENGRRLVAVFGK